MLDKQKYALKKNVAGRLGRQPIFNLKQDGTLYITWENPHDKESRAFDLEHNTQQVFIEGYANPVRLDVSNIEYSDPEKEDEPEVSMIPSGRYEQFMSQKIVSDALEGGSLSGQKLLYMSAANIAMLVVGIVIILAVVS